jgi:protein-tyrosine phosphatase
MSAKPPASRTATAKRPVPSPQEIAPGVFLGGWEDAVKFTGKRFCVLDEKPDEMPPGVHVPIYDDANDAPIVPNLDRLATEMRAAHKSGEPVIVFCGHGIRRGPLGAAWYLHRTEKIPLDQAYERIRAVRPKIETAREWIGNPDALES